MVLLSNYFGVLPKGIEDVDLDGDKELYLAPERVLKVDDPDFEGQDAQDRERIFMGTADALLDEPDGQRKLVDLLTIPHEMNETRLGLGKGKPQGSGTSAEMLMGVLKRNRKIAGLDISKHPESLLTFTPRFGQDRFSDLITNIYSDILAQFTQRKCRKYHIQMTKGHLLNFFNTKTKAWEIMKNVELPEHEGLAILFVPRGLLVKEYKYTAEDYVQLEILEGRKEMYKRQGKRMRKRDIFVADTANILRDKYKTYAQREAINEPKRYVEFIDKRRLLG